MRKYVVIFLIGILSIFLNGCISTLQTSGNKTDEDILFESAERNLADHRFNQALFEYSQFYDEYKESDKIDDVIYRIAYINVILGNYETANSSFKELLDNHTDSRWSFTSETWNKVLDELSQKPKTTTKTKKVYVKTKDDETLNEIENCRKENEELRERIGKLEKIIEGE